MSNKALYVYTTTTFTIDTQIEPMFGDPIGAGQVTLEPGIYRFPAEADLVPQTGAKGEGYVTRDLSLKGDGWPDPPQQAVEQYGMDQIESFLGGAGAPSAI